MNIDIENELRPILSGDEKLLWTGRPRTGILFRATDIFMIPFSVLWFGFAIFWEYSVVHTGVPFFALFGLLFVAVGLFMLIGRFFWDASKRKNTRYGITDTRVIIKSGLTTKGIKSLNIRAMSDITYKQKADGSGTISLGPTYTTFNGTGDQSGVRLSPRLDMIDDVASVYNLLIKQQRSGN